MCFIRRQNIRPPDGAGGRGHKEKISTEAQTNMNDTDKAAIVGFGGIALAQTRV